MIGRQYQYALLYWQGAAGPALAPEGRDRRGCVLAVTRWASFLWKNRINGLRSPDFW